MLQRSILAFFVSVPVLLLCKTVLAGPCMVVSDNPETGAVISERGTERVLTAKDQLSDCSQLILRRGTIHVLYQTPDGVVKRKTCTAPNTPCSVDAGADASFIETLRKLITYESRPGGKKMDKDVSRLAGIPYGRVFSRETAARFDMAKAGLIPWSLTLTETGSKTPIDRRSGSNPIAQVPVSLLRPGGKYAWTIESGGQQYRGGFDILSSADANNVAGEMSQIHKNTGITARARKLDELIVFLENNLDYETGVLREELGL